MSKNIWKKRKTSQKKNKIVAIRLTGLFLIVLAVIIFIMTAKYGKKETKGFKSSVSIGLYPISQSLAKEVGW